MGMRDHIPGVKKARIGDAGRASEKRVAKSLGARLRPASGAMAGAKGDMTVKDFLVESKSTTSASMSLSRDWLSKISAEAENEGRKPALTVSFTNEQGRPRNFGDWVMVPKDVWEEMIKGD